MDFTIKESDIETAVLVSKQIPELRNPHEITEYYKRFENKISLVLVAFADNRPVGFKAGYDRDGDGSFYSWMGGVIPEFRRHQVAKELAIYQEKWAKAQGFHALKFQTRNQHKAMLIFALKNGFNIISVSPRDVVEEHRILLQKTL